MLPMFFGIVIFALAGLGFMISIPASVYKQKASTALRHPRMIGCFACCALSVICLFGFLSLLPG